ncbi:hypothetical protein T459_30831 [Capsicum annuum]|uniref:Uncharacterized protein n=1 Tax=Capsicum annuum TaxID=4072 RepID=A0A2G2Y9G1_CAPAN|nr:hypothetical protein T459_30831 [Capsicum annuum]
MPSFSSPTLMIHHRILIHKFKFPSDAVGLPEGIENVSAITAPEMSMGVWKGNAMIQKPIEDLTVELHPHCIVSDVCLPWTVDVAERWKIPRLMFHPANVMLHCVEHYLKLYTPHEKVGSDSESFLIPGLPDNIEMKRSQRPE